MNIELINPNQIVKCVIGDRLAPSTWWKTEYFCTKRTPWYLRIFGVNKDKYEWVIYKAIYERPQHHPWFKTYYSSRDEFNKKEEAYFCDENWIVSRKAFVKLCFSDSTTIVRYFYTNEERNQWIRVNELSDVVEKTLVAIDDA